VIDPGLQENEIEAVIEQLDAVMAGPVPAPAGAGSGNKPEPSVRDGAAVGGQLPVHGTESGESA
jgi:hypothetical protein